MSQLTLFDESQFIPQARTAYQLGALGERIVLEALTKAGYEARPSERKRGEHFDVWAKDLTTGEIFRIEVKIARPAKDKKYHFTLYKAGRTDHAHASWVVLLAVSNTGLPTPFVVPTQAIAHQRQAVITSHPLKYRGKLAPYRQNLNHLELQ